MTKKDGIARILLGPPKQGSGDGDAGHAGMGIVIDSRHVLTCAHVVNDAIGRARTSESRPDTLVRVRFPRATGTERGASVIPFAWFPMGGESLSDIAVLELDGDVPEQVGVAHFVSHEQLDDDRLKIYGNRTGSARGRFVDAKFQGGVSVDGDARDQIDGTNVIGAFVGPGYSGAAVWDVEQSGVIGMVTDVDTKLAERIAYMAPLSALERAWPMLLIRQSVLPERSGDDESAQWPALIVQELVNSLADGETATDLSVLRSVIGDLPRSVRSEVQTEGLAVSSGDGGSLWDRVVRACVAEGQIPRLAAALDSATVDRSEVDRFRRVLDEIYGGAVFLPSMRSEVLSCLTQVAPGRPELLRWAGWIGIGIPPDGRLDELLERLAKTSPRSAGLPPALTWLGLVAMSVADQRPDVAQRLRIAIDELWTALGRSLEDLDALLERLKAPTGPPAERRKPGRASVRGQPNEVSLAPLNTESVLLAPWTEQTKAAQPVEQVARAWLSADPNSRPLVIVTHFEGDVRDVSMAIELVGRQFGRSLGLAQMVVEASDSQSISRAVGTIGSGQRRSVLIVEVGGRGDTVTKPDAAQWEWAGDLATLAERAVQNGHRIAMVLPRPLLRVSAVHRFVNAAHVNAFIAADLFRPGYELRGSVLTPDAPIPDSLQFLLRANSTSLQRAAAGALWNGAGVQAFALLPVADRLFREGFLEPAYRVELLARTDGRFRQSIALAADVLPIKDDRPSIVGLIEPVEQLPATAPRILLSGEDGSGRTCTLERMSHWWAVPRGMLTGLDHPPWLPVPISYSEGINPEGALRGEFGRNGRILPKAPEFQSAELQAHSWLAQHATPQNLRWLMSSAALLLIDGIQTQHSSCGEWLRAMQAAFAPTTGIVVSCDRRGEPRAQAWVDGVLGGGVRARIRPLDEVDVRAMAGVSSGSLCDLLGRIDRPVAEAVRNPHLCDVLRRAVNQGKPVVEWGLHRALEEDLKQQVGDDLDRETEDLITLALPTAALAQLLGLATELSKQQHQLAVELRLLEAGEFVRFSSSMLRDYFVALGVSQRVKQQGSKATVDWLFGSVSRGSPERWAKDWLTPLRILAGMDRHMGGMLIAELAALGRVDMALACARDLPTSEAELPIADIVREIANRLESRPRHHVKTGYTLRQAVADAQSLGAFDPRIWRDPARAAHLGDVVSGTDQFRLGRYPVTNTEFSRFIDAGGYSRRELWSEPDWEWLSSHRICSPAYWRHAELNRPNAPVVGVSVFEAMAYCRWLNTASGADEGGQPASWALPTPDQWDRAAGIADTLIMAAIRATRPGAIASEAEASSDESEHRIRAEMTSQLERLLEDQQELLDLDRLLGSDATRPTMLPVGLFPPNACGCHDMIGVLWQWCAPSTVEPAGVEQVRVKGGPLRNRLGAIWAVIGGIFDARTRFHEIGFRVCRISVEP